MANGIPNKIEHDMYFVTIAIIQNNNDKFVSDLRQVGGFFGFLHQ